MNIELTEEMKKEIIKQTSDKLANSLKASIKAEIDVKGLAAKVKSEIVGQLTSQIAGDFHKKFNTDDFVTRSLQGAEERINARIAKVLAQGITLKLGVQ